MLEVHPLELLDHPIRVCPIPCSHLPGKLIKSLVILLLLPGPPPWPAGDGLQAPVSGEGVVQQVEAVPGYIHLIHLHKFINQYIKLEITLKYIDITKHTVLTAGYSFSCSPEYYLSAQIPEYSLSAQISEYSLSAQIPEYSLSAQIPEYSLSAQITGYSLSAQSPETSHQTLECLPL